MAEMEIAAYTSELAEELSAVYNRAIAPVPHCHPVNASFFAESVRSGAAENSDTPPLQEQQGIVTREGGVITGFAFMGIGCPRNPAGTRQGVLRVFWYAPGHRKAGQQLLDATLAYARAHALTAIQAFPQEYRLPAYHLKAAYLSEQLAHVEALLGMNGFRRARGEVFLAWRNFAIARPSTPAFDMETVVNLLPGRGALPGFTVHALNNGQTLGVCTCVSCGEYASEAAAQDRMIVTWLGVKDKKQGQGLGRYLLGRALEEAARIGYQHSVISTEWDNYRAFVFYSNFGFTVSDWTYGFTRNEAD